MASKNEEPDAAEVLRQIRSYFSHQKEGAQKIIDSMTLHETLCLGSMGRTRLAEAHGPSDYLIENMEVPPKGVVAEKPMHFALKIMKKSEVVRLKQVDHVKHEKQILWEINHPFIVNLYATFTDERNLYLVLEHVEGGPLLTYLRDRGKFQNEHTRFYAAQIVMALQFLHNEAVVYRDLKPENLLIDQHGYLKMTDFCYAKKVQADERTWTLCGTPEYLAPEMIQTKGHNKAVDWWALGIVIYEMLAGYPPFFDENPFGIYQKILAGSYEFPRHFEVHAKDLIRKLLTADRTKRIGCLKNGAEDIKKHKWYRGLNWAALYNKQLDSFLHPSTKSLGTQNYGKFPDSNEESGPLLKAAKDHELFGSF